MGSDLSEKLARTLRFAAERWLQRGVFAQLTLIASIVGLIAALGGYVAWLATPRFATLGSAVWWAFLRLTDPGYLGDDEGDILRLISTIVTVLGYVLFMGSLIAIMTQWLMATLRRLESGVSPISMAGHVVILGWTNRTAQIVRKFLSARGRLRRFLDRRSTSKLRIVVLLDELAVHARPELDELSRTARGGVELLVRTGSSLRVQHLKRLDLPRAAAILIPGSDFELGGSEMSDARVIKALLGVRLLLSAAENTSTHVVAELGDELKLPVARSCMPKNLDVFAGNRVMSRIVSQIVVHRGLAGVFSELLFRPHGVSLYARAAPQLVGKPLHELGPFYAHAIPIGFVRPRDGQRSVIMDPRESTPLGEGDLVVFLAEGYDACEASTEGHDRVPPGHRAPASLDSEVQTQPLVWPKAKCKRVLFLGWSRKIPTIIAELAQSSIARIELTIVSRTRLNERETRLREAVGDDPGVELRHIVADYTVDGQLRAVGPHEFDHIVLLASDWQGSSEAADARTILCYALLTSLATKDQRLPEILVELLDPENESLLPSAPGVEILPSPRVQGHLLAYITLRPELNAVYDELFGAGGSDIDLLNPKLLDCLHTQVSFAQLQDRARRHGLTALGLRMEDESGQGTVHLNPRADSVWNLGPGDRLVAIVPSNTICDSSQG